MNEPFTGLGAGSTPQGGGITPGKVLVWGATAGLGYEAGGWLHYQWQRYQNWKAQRTEQPNDMPAEEQSEAATLLFMCWDGLREMRDWMAKEGGPVEQWEGDLAHNIKVCQYIEEFFPEAFKAWRTRNYTR